MCLATGYQLRLVAVGISKSGLEGKNLKLITTDGGAGLIAAVGSVWPAVPRQRCWAHKLRNVANKVRNRNERACLDGARLIYTVRTTNPIERVFREVHRRTRTISCFIKPTERGQDALCSAYIPKPTLG